MHHTLGMACASLIKGIYERLTVILMGYGSNQSAWMDRAQLM